MKSEPRKVDTPTVEQTGSGVGSPSVTVVDSKTMIISPEMQELIKQSLFSHLNGNPDIAREALKEFLIHNPNVLKDVVEELYNAPKQIPLISVDKVTARKMIREFIEEHPGSRTSEIILATELEPPLVMEILKELSTEGSIEKKTIEQGSGDLV